MGLKHDLWLSRKTLAGFGAIGVAWATYFAQMPVIKQAVNASDGAYGVAVLFGAFGALCAMWFAPLCQRLAGGMALPLAIGVLGCGMLGAGLSSGVVMLALVMLLAAAGTGIVDVLVNARISEVEARSSRNLMNLNHAFYSFSYAGAALATGWLREAGIGPAAMFAGLGAVLAVLAWATRGVVPDIEEGSSQGDWPVPHALVFIAGLVVLIAFLAETSSEGWSALHLERTLGGTPAQGAMGPALLGLTMGFGRLAGHAVARWMRDTTLMLMACILSACGLAVAGLAGSLGAALAGFALTGLGISVVVPLALAFVGRMVPPAARLAAISRASVLGYGAFFFGPPLMGLMSEFVGLRIAFLTVAGLLVMAALALIPMLTRRAARVPNTVAPQVSPPT